MIDVPENRICDTAPEIYSIVNLTTSITIKKQTNKQTKQNTKTEKKKLFLAVSVKVVDICLHFSE